MEVFVIAVVAGMASMLTFFSGFGLGTILTPVFILFFPVEVAIALTGVVHLLNNFFKIVLIGKHINWQTGVKFGITALVGAFAGAELLFWFSSVEPLYTYSISGRMFYITSVKLLIAALMIVFALFEIVPSLKKIEFSDRNLFAGGFISGFFGGLSGNQGALRSMFLIKCGLNKESFIATGVLIACIIDVTRLSIYFSRMSDINIGENLFVLIVAVFSAFLGAYAGNKLLKKVTLHFVQNTLTLLIILLAIGLGFGLI